MPPTYTTQSVSIDSLLHNEVIMDVVKHEFAVGSAIPDLLGMGYIVVGDGDNPRVEKGPGYIQTPWGREIAMDIWNSTRRVAPTATPMQPSINIGHQVIGQQRYTAARLAINVDFMIERLHGLRRVGMMPGKNDALGVDYIRRQCKWMSEQALSWRLALVGGMIRDSLYIERGTQDQGDRIAWSQPSGAFDRINYGIPRGQIANHIGTGADNTTTFALDLLGTGTNIIDAAWSTITTDIPTQLIKINDAFGRLGKLQLNELWMTHTTASYLMNNNYVRQLAGSVNTPFIDYSREQATDKNGVPLTGFNLVLRGMPWVNVRMIYEPIDMPNDDGTFTTELVIPEGYVFATVKPDPNFYRWIEAEEPIADGPNMDPHSRYGLYTYCEHTHNPPRKICHLFDNGLPAVINPYSFMYFKVAE